MAEFPELSPRSGLQCVVVLQRGILISKLLLFLGCLVPHDCSWEANHILDQSGGVFWLHKVHQQALSSQVGVETEPRLVSIGRANAVAANGAHADLLGCNGDHLFGDDVLGHYIEGFEQVSIILAVSLLDVIDKDVSLSGILLEVILQLSVAH